MRHEQPAAILNTVHNEIQDLRWLFTSSLLQIQDLRSVDVCQIVVRKLFYL